MASFTVNPITIGYNGQTFNAFYTGITNFYLDGGIAFVIMIPFLFGMIIAIFGTCLIGLLICILLLSLYLWLKPVLPISIGGTLVPHQIGL